MPFSLKNAGATYQRTMLKCFNKQTGVSAQVYIDDIAVNSKQGSGLLGDLQQTFDNLHNFSMKLKPKKCVFGVPAGQLLGSVIS